MLREKISANLSHTSTDELIQVSWLFVFVNVNELS